MEQLALMIGGPAKERVIESCRRGDRESFRLLFETYKDRVYTVALYFFGGDEQAAADVTQQVFLKLFTRIAQFRREAEFTTWLYRLTINACIDERRRGRKFDPLDEAVAPRTAHGRYAAEEGAERREASEAVREAVASLRPKLRAVVLLKYFEELSYEEIAEVLGCSKGTVASRLNRGHKALARKLGHLRGALFQGD